MKKIDCQEEFIIPSTNSPKLEIEPKPKKEIKAIGINLQETLKFLDR